MTDDISCILISCCASLYFMSLMDGIIFFRNNRYQIIPLNKEKTDDVHSDRRFFSYPSELTSVSFNLACVLLMK